MELTEHRKYALVVLGLFFIWGGISFYWYTCGIKGFCAQAEPVAVVSQGGGHAKGGQGVQTPAVEECAGLMYQYVIPGAQNDPAAVKALEYFLYTFEGEDISMDGVYGTSDIAAVKRFQQKYRTTILTPYGLSQPTGRVQESTLYVINTLYCSSVVKQ
jgi:hypothetical protein